MANQSRRAGRSWFRFQSSEAGPCVSLTPAVRSIAQEQQLQENCDLLAVVGRKPSDAALVRKNVATGSGFAVGTNAKRE